MIKLKDLLKENPDTLKYKGGYYKYNIGNSNVATFFMYHDGVLDKDFYFGYSTLIKDFFSDNKELLSIIKQIKGYKPGLQIPDFSQGDILSVQDFIDRYYNKEHSMGHSELEFLLYDLKRRPSNVGKSRSRLFRVNNEEHNVSFVLTIWDPDDGKSFIKYKDFHEKCLRNIGVDPKTVLYEVEEETFNSYDELFSNVSQDSEGKVETEIDKEIKKLNNEYSELMGSLHVRGATLSTADEKRLQSQISAVKTKIDILKKTKEQGITTMDDASVQLSILKAIQNAPESDPKSLGIAINAELEKKFKGMTLAQIKQIVKGASLRDLVKEVYESFKNTKKKLFG